MGRSYRAVCFDLDGTLLPMDIDEFMAKYFAGIAAFMTANGQDGERFMAALKAGTKAMATHADDALNSDAFWRTFFEVYGVADLSQQERLQQLSTRYYDEAFPHIGDGFQGDPTAARVIAKLAAKGYPLVLTTMPMFPRAAVEHRLEWAGVDPAAFARITHYGNSKSVKPKQTYYAENLAAMGVAGDEVLMVGNNTMEDLSFLDLGADAYLVTDWLLDPVGFDLDTVRHGSMADLEAWVDGLPACADPAASISDAPVAQQAMQQALAANAVDGLDLADAARKAAAVADAVAGDHEPGAAGRLKVR